MANNKLAIIGGSGLYDVEEFKDRELLDINTPWGKPSDKILKIYGFCNVCGLEATKTFRKTEGGKRTQVGAANIYEPRCLKHWEPR